MTFTPSDMQGKAINAIKRWYENRTTEQQIFRVFGYAGSGKTTIVSYAIGELGLKPGVAGLGGDVLYAAFTGKAALVMARNGTPACTIHSLIYHVSEPTEAEIEECGIRRNADTDSSARRTAFR